MWYASPGEPAPIFVTCAQARAGKPYWGGYATSKAALEAMTRTWSRELAERATVNAVNPGPVEGGMYMDGGQRLWEELEPLVV